jgi:hypothetical protein
MRARSLTKALYLTYQISPVPNQVRRSEPSILEQSALVLLPHPPTSALAFTGFLPLQVKGFFTELQASADY